MVRFHFCETAEQASPWKQKAEKQLSGAGRSREGRRLLMGTRVSLLSSFFFYRGDENVLELDSGDSCRALSIY